MAHTQSGGAHHGALRPPLDAAERPQWETAEPIASTDNLASSVGPLDADDALLQSELLVMFSCWAAPPTHSDSRVAHLSSETEDGVAEECADNDSGLSQLDIKRKRNRESMRRVRLRKRDARMNMQKTVDELEERLRNLMSRNTRAVQRITASGDSQKAVDANNSTPYASLAAETVALSEENNTLREDIRTQIAFRKALIRAMDEESATPDSSNEAQPEVPYQLAPLLEWLNASELAALVRLACKKIFENHQFIQALVPTPNVALGWSDSRTLHNRWAHYLLSKNFFHQGTDVLMQRTWEYTVNIELLGRVMRWANVMKVLHWLSDDAAIISRELDIPSPDGGIPTRFCFTLLVFRQQTANGFIIATQNLNIYGSTVDECLQPDVSYTSGMNAHTMYGWVFTRLRDKATDREIGCNVTLVGLTGNGSTVYAHNVLMEMITVALLWENALVAPIFRLCSVD